MARKPRNIEPYSLVEVSCRTIGSRFLLKPSKEANELIGTIRAADLNLAVWDTTSEIGVASFICRIAEPEGADPMPYELLDAAGCHPVREVALARAILEAVQGRATMISGARDDLFYNYYETNDARCRER